MRTILEESFRMFRNIELSPNKMKEYEDRVFSGAFFLSPRSAAKAILEIMDNFTLEEMSERHTTI